MHDCRAPHWSITRLRVRKVTFIGPLCSLATAARLRHTELSSSAPGARGRGGTGRRSRPQLLDVLKQLGYNHGIQAMWFLSLPVSLSRPKPTCFIERVGRDSPFDGLDNPTTLKVWDNL